MANVDLDSAAAGEGKQLSPLRVLFYLFFPGSGIGRYTHELLKHLSAFPEVDAELVCLPSYHWLDQATYPVWPGLREIGYPWPWRRKARFLIGQLANPLRLCRRAREMGVDIIHLSNINHLTYAMWGKSLRRAGAKVVATVHDVRRARGIINLRYETRQLKGFYKSADALFAHSQAQVEDLEQFAAVERSRIHIVPMGGYDYGTPRYDALTLRQRYCVPEDKQVALFFGNIRDEKNLDLLLRVLPRHRSSLHLVVAGRGGGGKHKGMAYYRSLVRELHVEDSVLFLDKYIPDEEVPDLFTLCDWVALPYSRSFTSQSGVLNLAAQYRRPLLLSAAPTLAETMDQCDIGVLVEPDDVVALDRGVQEIQEQVRTGYPYEFQRYSQLFGWDENARRTVAVYRALLAMRPARA